jgi:hypothetical protein
VNDATWLADLMAHGLIQPSFVPNEPTQQKRDLLRTRKQFVRERCGHTQRIQKVRKSLQGRRKTAGQIPPDILVQYVASTFILVLNWWVESRSALPPEATQGMRH